MGNIRTVTEKSVSSLTESVREAAKRFSQKCQNMHSVGANVVPWLLKLDQNQRHLDDITNADSTFISRIIRVD